MERKRSGNELPPEEFQKELIKRIHGRQFRAIRGKTLLQPQIDANNSIMRVLDDSIANVRYNEESKEMIDGYLGNKEFISSVLQLHGLMGQIYEKIEVIEECLKVDLKMDSSGNQPILDQDNLSAWYGALSSFYTHLEGFPKVPSTSSSDGLNSSMEAMKVTLQYHNENPLLFCNLAQAKEIVVKIVQMMNGLTDNSNFSLSKAIENLVNSFNTAVQMTQKIYAQCSSRRQYEGSELPEELVESWKSVVKDLDFGWVIFATYMNMIFGPRACWLLSQVQMERLEALLKQLNADIGNAKLYLSFAQQSSSSKLLLQNIAKNIDLLIRERKLHNPPQVNEMEDCIREMLDQKNNLTNAIKTKRLSSLPPAGTPDKA